jgi:hypothetical protein
MKYSGSGAVESAVVAVLEKLRGQWCTMCCRRRCSMGCSVSGVLDAAVVVAAVVGYARSVVHERLR